MVKPRQKGYKLICSRPCSEEMAKLGSQPKSAWFAMHLLLTMTPLGISVGLPIWLYQIYWVLGRQGLCLVHGRNWQYNEWWREPGSQCKAACVRALCSLVKGMGESSLPCSLRKISTSASYFPRLASPKDNYCGLSAVGARRLFHISSVCFPKQVCIVLKPWCRTPREQIEVDLHITGSN